MRDDHPLREYNGLEGCMSGRMAMNTPWEVAKIDREVYGETDSNTMTREEILLVSQFSIFLHSKPNMSELFRIMLSMLKVSKI